MVVVHPCLQLLGTKTVRPAFYHLKPGMLGLTVTLHALPLGVSVLLVPIWNLVGVRPPAPLPCQPPLNPQPGTFLGGFNKMTFPLPVLSFTCLGISCFL